jgi:hypothetical protein
LLDDGSWQEVVGRFRAENDPGVIREIREALLELLATNDDGGVATFLGTYSAIDPTSAEFTGRAWVESIVHILAGGESREPGSSLSEARAVARRRAAEVASEVLDGQVDYILGARQLVGLRSSVDVPDGDQDFTIFTLIDSETDALPVGPARARWDPSALARLEPDIVRARSWAREVGAAAFRNVVGRFSLGGKRVQPNQTGPEAVHVALKLLETFHLSVSERRTLPPGGIPLSSLVTAVSARLDAASWFPTAIDPGKGIGEGARIERRGPELWLHEQHELGVGRFGAIRSRLVDSIEEAIRLYVEANGGSPIDGVKVDWES